jgi:transposase
MNTKTNKTNRTCETPPGSAQAPTIKAQAIKLGIDVHADRDVVVRQMDGNTPQPAQTFTPAAFLDWVKTQFALAERVYTCYEAGPFGYGLHRDLTALGATNYVVRPRDWDEYGKKVKTDRRDARQLVLALDRYVAGNHDAFCVVRVPTPAEEQARSGSRARQSFQEEKQRLAAKGRSTALYYGHRLEGEWFAPALWKDLAPTLPPHVRPLLEPLQRLIVAVDQELTALTRQVEAAAPADLPVGMGKLTSQILEREICDWARFENRRQVGSYTGMCPREDPSSDRRFQGPINKHGNPRVRATLIELSWRLLQFQPSYRAVAKWRPVLANPKTTKAKRKQIVVALGRQFSVDWWRVRTARCTAGQLGLKLKPVAASAPRAAGTSTPTSLAHVSWRGSPGAEPPSPDQPC